MNARYPLLLILLALVTALLYNFLPARDTQAIKIGVVLPLTGDFASFGQLGLQGVKLAAAEINSSGGVLNGRPIELVVQDNESDPNLAVQQTRKLIQEDGVLAIVGPVSSPARQAMSTVARQFKTPLLYGIDYEGGHFDRYLFCYSPIPDHVITPLIPYLAEHHGSKLYIFGYDYVWPHEMSRLMAREVEKVGGEVVATEFTPFGVSDFSPVLQRVAASGADVMMLVMCGRDGQRFAGQFHHAGLKERIQLVAIASEESWSKKLSPAELEGILTISPFLSSMDSSESRNLTGKIEELFGDDAVVTYSTESHYGLIRLLAQAIEKAGTIADIEALIDAMEGQELTVGTGKVTMRRDHHMNLNMVIATFKNGKLLVQKKLGLISPADQRTETR
ncbi:substrate-binding protein [Desulfogranum mediterraneum]|uniref:substrate-binding protein n=1 Tax=Desulfogranum mediterraneum TaxID=160661 RepID=UPI0004901AF9|nr:substrate-binding protein [Desulfogranum mediterraneum]